MQPSTIMTIGPADATRLLENNRNNRTISDKIVRQYADDMREGRWKETGNPINIGVSGNLLNGQHRLWAIIESGVTLRFHVIYETDEEAFATFDTGRTRDLTQLISISDPGHPDKAVVGGAARLVKMWEDTPTAKSAFNSNLLPTRATMSDFAHRMLQEKEFDWATRVAGQINSLKAGRTWYAAALYIIAHQQGGSYGDRTQEMLDTFHQGISKGIALAEGDPRLALRNYVISRGAPKGSTTEQRIYMALTIRAWNAWLEGKSVRNFAWRSDGEFPKARKAV